MKDQGVENLDDMYALEVVDVKDMMVMLVKHEPSTHPTKTIRVPFPVLKKLVAVRHWIELQIRTGQALVAQLCTDDEISETMRFRREVSEKKEASLGTTPTNPEPLKTFGSWQDWFELWDNYMLQIVGAAEIPLRYIYRKTESVSVQVLDAAYSTGEDQFYNTTELKGSHFDLDNERVWNEMKSLVMNGPGWSFIKGFEDKMDGRQGILALKKQNEGECSSLVRKQRAYKILRDTVFSGTRKNWSFTDYVTKNLKSHNELADCNESVSDTKKVSDFLEGITDPTLASDLGNVYGDRNKLTSFQECQQYLSTLITSTRLHSKLLKKDRFQVQVLGGPKAESPEVGRSRTTEVLNGENYQMQRRIISGSS